MQQSMARAEATEKQKQKERQMERPPSLISALALEGKWDGAAMLAEKYSRLHDVRRNNRVCSRYYIEATQPQSPRYRAIEEEESQSPPGYWPPRDFFVHVRATEDLPWRQVTCDPLLTLREAQSQQSGASQWLNAPSKAHPDNCRPCWFTAKNRGCDRDGCLFCHQPHDIGDVYRTRTGQNSARTRQRQAKRQAQVDFLNAHIRVKGTSQSPAAPEERHCNLPRWPLSDFQAVRMGLVLPKSDTKNDRR